MEVTEIASTTNIFYTNVWNLDSDKTFQFVVCIGVLVQIVLKKTFFGCCLCS